MFRSVFFGTPEFSLKSLEATHKNSQLIAVVTQPDRPRGRGMKLSPCEVKAWAIEKGIRTFSPPSLRKDSPERAELLNFLMSEKPDIFMVTAYGLIFPEAFLNIAKLGCFNVHASLLPRWRGAAPIQRAIEAGDRTTGVCLQKMVLEMDAGDVCESVEVAIREDHNAMTLSQDLSQASFALVETFFRDLERGSLKLTPQSKEGVTFAEKITKEQGQWSPAWSASELIRRTRAFAAWPKVSVRLEGVGEIKILAAAPGHAGAQDVGSIEVNKKDSRIFLSTGTPAESVELQSIQVPGKGPCRAYDYFQNLSSSIKLRAL